MNADALGTGADFPEVVDPLAVALPVPLAAAVEEAMGFEPVGVTATIDLTDGPRRRSEVDTFPPTVSVIIPAMNEAGNIAHVIERVPAWVSEIIVVDGHSTDNTREVAAAARCGVRVIEQSGRGKGQALATGFAAATGDILVMLDADGSTDPAEIPRFVAALRTGADFAKGTRFVVGGGSTDISFLRRSGNWALGRAVNLLWRAGYSDLCYGYNAFWRHLLPVLHIDTNGFEVETLLNIKAVKAGLRIVEVPSYEANRMSGRSNLSAHRDGMRVLRTILAERIRPT